MVDGSAIDDPGVRSLLEASPPHTAKLATVRPDGGPHVAAGVVRARRGPHRVHHGGHDGKGPPNLRRDPRVALCVDDDVRRSPSLS